MPPEESLCPCRVQVSCSNPSHDELLQVFFSSVFEMNFGLLDKLWTAASATSAATCCAHAICTLIDAAEQYDCCPAWQQTRPIEILWISTAQTGLTHQQKRNLWGPRRAERGIHQFQV